MSYGMAVQRENGMPPLHLLFYFLFGTALFGGGGAIIHNMTPPAEPELSQPVKPKSPVKQQVPVKKQAAGSPAKPALPESSVVLPSIAPPSFDIVRIEPNGDGVIAGRAEPGWKVVIQSGGDKIETALADKNGEWVVVLSRPLPPGEYAIGLSSYGPDGTRSLVSEQEVTVSVAKREESQQAIIALSQPGKPTQVLSPGEEAISKPAQAKADENPLAQALPAKPEEEVQVVVNAVDYEQDGQGAGTVFLSGAASPGKRVSLYLDNVHVGDVVAGGDGRWTYSARKELQAETTHKVRADALHADGRVMSRAEVPFAPRITIAARKVVTPRNEARSSEARQQVPSEVPQTAMPRIESAIAKPAPSGAGPVMSQAGEVAALLKVPEEKVVPEQAMLPKSQIAKAKPVSQLPKRKAPPSRIIVRRGDTLWNIAKRRYGKGHRYTAIYRQNRRQIRSPHLIYPGQIVQMPLR